MSVFTFTAGFTNNLSLGNKTSRIKVKKNNNNLNLVL